MIETLKVSVQKNWMLDNHKNMVVYVPPKASQYAICYVMFNNNADRRNEFIEKAAIIGLEPEHVKQCLVIAKNVDDNNLAYHFIGLME